MKKRLGEVLGVGSVCFSTHVGPGFASGTMCLIYLVENGWTAFILGPLIGAGVAGIILYAHLETGRLYNVYDYKGVSDVWMDWNKPLQKIIAVARDIVWVGFTLTVTASLMAIMQTVCMDVWGIPNLASGVFYVGLVIILCLFGDKLVRDSGNFIVAGIIVIILFIVVICWPQASPQGFEVITNFVSYRAPILVAYYLYLYIGNCTSGIYAALAASEGAIKTRKDVIVACLSFVIPVVVLNSLVAVIFLAGMPEISGQDIPFLWAISNFSNSTAGAVCYGLLVIFAVIGTGVGFCQTIFKRLCNFSWGKKLEKEHYKLTMTIVCLITMLVVTPLAGLGVYTLISVGISACMNFQVPLYIFGVITAVYAVSKQCRKLRAKGINPAGDVTETYGAMIQEQSE